MLLIHIYLLFCIELKQFINIMSNTNHLAIERKRKTELSQCQICEAPAFYSYFGVISCEACKVFFRRHAHFGQVISTIYLLRYLFVSFV